MTAYFSRPGRAHYHLGPLRPPLCIKYAQLLCTRGRQTDRQTVLAWVRLGLGVCVGCFIAEALILTLAADLCASHRPAVTGSSSHSCAHIDWRNIRWPPPHSPDVRSAALQGSSPAWRAWLELRYSRTVSHVGRTRNSLGLRRLFIYLFIRVPLSLVVDVLIGMMGVFLWSFFILKRNWQQRKFDQIGCRIYAQNNQ